MIEITASNIFMVMGFLLSLYACVSNDAIQTLGTFLNTTKNRPVWQIWLYVSAVMVITFVVGWIVNDGDMAFGRLDRIPQAEVFYWWHVLPPLILLYLTKKGIPVATAFLIISIFSAPKVIGLMVAKSFVGYVLALISSLILYFIIARKVEKIFLYMKNKPISKPWVVAKWLSTAFLWSAWLLQDGAVLFVYGFTLPRDANGVDEESSGEICVMYMTMGDQLAAKMYVQYVIDPDFEPLLKQLYRTGVCVGIKTFDPNINDQMLSTRIRISKYPVKIIKVKTKGDRPEVEQRVDSGIVSKGSSKSLLQTLSLCERVTNATKNALIVKLFSLAISVIISILLLIFAKESVNSFYVALYQIFWIVPTVLLTKLSIGKL